MNRPPPNGRDLATRLGRVMLLGAWAVGLLMLALAFDGWLDREHNPNPDPTTLTPS